MIEFGFLQISLVARNFVNDTFKYVCFKSMKYVKCENQLHVKVSNYYLQGLHG